MSTDDAIVELVTRLSRPHPAGGHVIERAAILAEGTGAAAVFAWITAHAGEPEAISPQLGARGLHAARIDLERASERKPLRYVLPAGALARGRV